MGEILADNGSYFLAAYAIVIGGLGGYVLWLRGRLRRAHVKPSDRV